MKDVAVRGVAEKAAQLDAIGEQVKIRAPRDVEQKLSEDCTRGVGERD